MSEHLLIDPNALYKLYSYRDIVEYYHFDFLAKFTSIEIDIFYDILNSISSKQVSNLNNYIFKQWSLTRKMLEIENLNGFIRNNDILQRTYTNKSIESKDTLNNKLSQLIQGDQVMSLYIMNQLLKFLYPYN
jgi:hypothetical protein|tara:strand:- start:245 stop:640 length:396 start_codon:yes stop_codon:yes gene_type:complete